LPRPSGNRTSRHDRRAVVQAALVSIALHGLVVCWLIRAAPFGGANHDAPRVLQMQLLALPNSRPDRPKPQPDPMQSDRQSDPEPGPESDAVPTKVAPPAPPVGAGALSDADVDSGAAPTNAAETPDPARLRARILDQIAALRPDAQDKRTACRVGGTRQPGPRPTRPARLAVPVCGTVAPSVENWREADGSQRARIVLADGTVICTERRAPTNAEFANPWKSTIVTMARICGREHPAEPDFTDPRMQPPPSNRRPDTRRPKPAIQK